MAKTPSKDDMKYIVSIFIFAYLDHQVSIHVLGLLAFPIQVLFAYFGIISYVVFAYLDHQVGRVGVWRGDEA